MYTYVERVRAGGGGGRVIDKCALCGVQDTSSILMVSKIMVELLRG